MVIINKKEDNDMLPTEPPPAYTSESFAPSSSRLANEPAILISNEYRKPTLTTLPSYILLHIIYQTLRQSDGRFYGESKNERQRKVLYWMSISLRLVDRALYIACMHILRSTYLPSYSTLIRAPYTSDAFPLTADSANHSNMLPPINAISRETQVLDYFIALKLREDVWADESELHLERNESFRDLFDLMQPRARLEDLIRIFGIEEGSVSVAPSSSASQNNISGGRIIPFSQLSVSFSSRRVGLVLYVEGVKRIILEVSRQKDEPLEIAARKVVVELKTWLSRRV